MLKDDYDWPPGRGLLKILIERGYTKKDLAEGFEKSYYQVDELVRKYKIVVPRNIITPEFKKLAQKWIKILNEDNKKNKERLRKLEFERLDRGIL